jgi:hypothetical protein
VNEAYCAANPGIEYVVFFPDGGHVLLDVSAAEGKMLTVRWMDIRRGAWVGEAAAIVAEEGKVRLVTPVEEGYWTAVVKAS